MNKPVYVFIGVKEHIVFCWCWFFGNAKQTNAVFFCNIWCLSLVITKASFLWFGLVWLHKCWYMYSFSEFMQEEKLSSFLAPKKRYLHKNILSMKSTTFKQTMKKLCCPLRRGVGEDQWEAWNRLCDLRSKERPWKKTAPIGANRHPDRQTTTCMYGISVLYGELETRKKL